MNKLELIAGLEVEKDDLLKRVASLDHTILTLKQSLNFDVPSHHNGNGVVSKANGSTLYDQFKDYHKAKGNKDRAIAILRGAGKFLHMRQIVKIAQSLEPQEKPEAVKAKIQQGVYALRNLENSPIANISVGESRVNTFWGSKGWLNDKGEIKPEFMYDEKELSNSSEIIEI